MDRRTLVAFDDARKPDHPDDVSHRGLDKLDGRGLGAGRLGALGVLPCGAGSDQEPHEPESRQHRDSCMSRHADSPQLKCGDKPVALGQPNPGIRVWDPRSSYSNTEHRRYSFACGKAELDRKDARIRSHRFVHAGVRSGAS